MPTDQDLYRTLDRIDGKGYKAYHDIRGHYDYDLFRLYIDHVQGDPFAAPSKLRVGVEHQQAEIPDDLYNTPVRRLALEDYLARRARERMAEHAKGHRGSGKSGALLIDAGAQEVLERTACRVREDGLELRLEAGLPARGRTVLGYQAQAMLTEELPRVVSETLQWTALPQHEVYAFVECVENQEHIRKQLRERNLVAFVADGSVLPRESGASDRPLSAGEAVPFRSPERLRVDIDLLNEIDWRGERRHTLSGLGIPHGVTLIVGGGYHGKSTLLAALERGVYPHIPGDGREYVVADPDLVKIRSEDGRSVTAVDIRPFIGALPSGRDTRSFSSANASGSTSQAANIVEALEVGASGLLLDEDTCATNFMVRDARMQALVAKEHEPITPFLDQIDALYRDRGVSTVLVMGGSGDYFEVADVVMMMRDYQPIDVTDKAKRIANEQQSTRQREAGGDLGEQRQRVPDASSLDPRATSKKGKVKVRGREQIQYGHSDLDLRDLEQLVDRSQTAASAAALELLGKKLAQDGATLRELMDALETRFDREGVETVSPFQGQHPGNLARPRRFEIAAALNRLRVLRVTQRDDKKDA